jgi:hypothetical protein
VGLLPRVRLKVTSNPAAEVSPIQLTLGESRPSESLIFA